MTNSVPIGFLGVRQSTIRGAADLASSYDLAITAVGWETRSNHALPLYASIVKEVTFFHFKSTDPMFLARKQKALDNARDIARDRVHVYELTKSIDFYGNVGRIEQMIVERVEKAGKPLSLLIDVTCIPKRYFLFLIGMGFKRGLFCRVDVLYSEGRYHPPTVKNALESPYLGFLSGGDWASVQVPYLEGSNYAPDKRDLFVSVGAEVTQAVPIVERFEPAKLKLFHVAGSEHRFPTSYLDSEVHALSSLKELTGTENATFELSDVIGLAKSVLAGKSRVTTCLAIGAKPHALAFGIAALADDDIQVVCRNPQGYILNDVSPAGNVFCFHIEDRFEPSAVWR